jgi:hypothetical protein
LTNRGPLQKGGQSGSVPIIRATTEVDGGHGASAFAYPTPLTND